MLMLALAGIAQAKCAMAQPTLFPADGAVPDDPVLHLFVAWGEVPAITAEGATIAVKAVSETPGLRAYEVRVQTDQPRFTITLGRTPHVYEVDSAWVAPTAATPRFASAEAESSAWACSYTEIRSLRPEVDAPAYRVVWAASQQAWEAGETHTLVMPRNTDELWLTYGEPRVVAPEIPLGHVSCMGFTHEWRGPIWVSAAALWPDGTSSGLAAPVRLDPPPDAYR